MVSNFCYVCIVSLITVLPKKILNILIHHGHSHHSDSTTTFYHSPIEQEQEE